MSARKMRWLSIAAVSLLYVLATIFIGWGFNPSVWSTTDRGFWVGGLAVLLFATATFPFFILED